MEFLYVTIIISHLMKYNNNVAIISIIASKLALLVAALPTTAGDGG